MKHLEKLLITISLIIFFFSFSHYALGFNTTNHLKSKSLPEDSLRKINFEIKNNKILLKGIYSLKTKEIKIEIFIKNIELKILKTFIKKIGIKNGYIKNSKLILTGKKEYKLEGYLKLKEIHLTQREIEYTADLNLSLKILLSKDGISYYSAEGKLRDGRIFGCTPYLEEISNIVAEFGLNKDSFNLKEAQLDYKDIHWKINGRIYNFSFPIIELNAESDLFNLSTEGKYNYKKEKIEISKLLLKNKNTEIFSRINITNIKKDPQLKIEGLGIISFEDLKKTFKLLKINYSWINKLNPEGKLNLKFTVDGRINPKTWKIKLAGYSKNLKLYNLETDKTKIELYKDEEKLIISPLLINYDKGSIDFRTKLEFPYNKGIINLTLNDIDLEKIRKELNLKNKKLSGKLSADLYLENNNLKNWESWNGEGTVYIKEGNLWEINLFRGIGEFLFIPNFENIKFEEGGSDLIFRGEEIIFQNLELKSQKMNLLGGGKISLQGNIEFLLFPEFNPSLVFSSKGLKKIITRFLGKGGLCVEIKGTFKKPEYKIKPVFLTPLKNIKKFFEELIK
jgi:hypothetical protein